MHRWLHLCSLLLLLAIFGHPASAQNATQCRNMTFIMVADISNQANAVGVRDLYIQTVKHVMGRLLLDKAIRCPESSYSVGVYYYGEGDFLTPLPVQANNLIVPAYTDSNWLNELRTTLQNQTEILSQTQGLTGSSSYVEPALQQLRTDMANLSGDADVLVLSSGLELDGRNASETFANDLPNARVTVFQGSDNDRWGLTNAQDVSENFLVKIDNFLDTLLPSNIAKTYSCDENIPVSPFQDRFLLELRGELLRDRYNLNINGQARIREGVGDDRFEVLQTDRSSNRYWVTGLIPLPGNWRVTNNTGEPCSLRLLTIPLLDQRNTARVTEKVVLYGEEPYYDSDSDTRLTLEIAYSNGQPVAPVTGFPMDVVGNIRQANNDEIIATIPFRYADGIWTSETPPYSKSEGNYTVELVGRGLNTNSQTTLFSSALRNYQISGIPMARFVLEAPSQGTTPESALPINCYDEIANQTTNCTLRVTGHIEQIADNTPLIGLSRIFNPIEPAPAKIELIYDNEVVSQIDMSETGTEGVLTAQLSLVAGTGVKRDTSTQYSLRLTVSNNAVRTNNFFIEKDTLSLTQDVWLTDNTDTKIPIELRFLQPSVTDNSFSLYTSFPGNCRFLGISKVSPMPIQLQAANQLNALPLTFTDFGDGNSTIEDFVTVTAVHVDSDSSAEVLMTGDDAAKVIRGDLGPTIEQINRGVGNYVVKLEFNDNRIKRDQYTLLTPLGTNSEGVVELPFTVNYGSFMQHPTMCGITIAVFSTLSAMTLVGFLLFSMLFKIPGRLFAIIEDRAGGAVEPLALARLNRPFVWMGKWMTWRDINLQNRGVEKIRVRRNQLLSRRDIHLEVYNIGSSEPTISTDMQLGDTKRIAEKIKVSYVSDAVVPPAPSAPPVAEPPSTSGGINRAGRIMSSPSTNTGSDSAPSAYSKQVPGSDEDF